ANRTYGGRAMLQKPLNYWVKSMGFRTGTYRVRSCCSLLRQIDAAL
ncbi:hypothetical protein EVAR_71650_1, partial [Eumeta japonica]